MILCSLSLWTKEGLEAFWKVLVRCGVPTRMLGIIKSFHEGMKAKIRAGGLLSDSIEVMNSLRQGYTLGPTSRSTLESVVQKQKFVTGGSEWGVTGSTGKTKGKAMVERLSDTDIAPIKVAGGEIEMVG